MIEDAEQIVFVNEDGTPTGEIGPKLASHTADTKLHLAFSCYIFRKSDNAFLVTKRDSDKKVWPGVWTNSVCGHPAPGEPIEATIRRRAQFELGINELDDITCVLPTYRYTTPPSNGIVENEFCPVYVAYTSEEPLPHPEEVEDLQWLSWPAYVAFMEANAATMSYWAKDQYQQLKDQEPFASLG
ncbi:MAG TPA: isopentenyl-diphosphate Delta-isomerase [Candidatus Saccharimonadales bacterium]|nr:isopentenyl-diphosphate Delta-isomerase [Candidatus Saccharimonadales bacterium]